MWQELLNKVRTMDTPKGLDSQEYRKLFASEKEYETTVKHLFKRLYHDTLDMQMAKHPKHKEISAKLLEYSTTHSEAFRHSEELFNRFSAYGTKSENEIALFNKMLDSIQQNVNEEVQHTSQFTVATRNLYSISKKGYDTSINPKHILDIFDNFNGRLQRKEFIPINLIGNTTFKDSFASRVHDFIKFYVEDMKKTVNQLSKKQTLTEAECEKLNTFLVLINHIAMNGMYRIDETMSDGQLKGDVGKLKNECEQLLREKAQSKAETNEDVQKEEVLI